MQAPVAQPPSAPAQQGMEQECAFDRTVNGTTLDKIAIARSAAERARTRGREWKGTARKGEIQTSSETIETPSDRSGLCHTTRNEGKINTAD
ncbi:MAG: hypothetical protein ICV60_10250 [Pyrinomonadaceae bacterium]|nr:hypothetical protein [Pyrinomonadaceae bacterium]